MSNSFKDFESGDICLLKRSQESYWQYTEQKAKDILLYTEKSLIYEAPSKVRFKEGSDVLVRWTDGLLYLGNIIQVEDEYSRCAVKFEDGSQYWALYKDIHKGPPLGNEVICTICDSDVSDPPDEIVICDKCSVGYHQYCHVPKINSEVLKPEVAWSCRKCVFACTTKIGGALRKGPKAQAMQSIKQTLPYNLESLTWDVPHRSNLQQTYCYCGGPGEWYMKMLQCLRCKQWFHEACLQCLEEPLLFGDRFYIFVCSVCNKGDEFLRRIALRWPDIAHLVLFNLTVIHGKKYFDLDDSIINFLKDKWSQLQVKGEEVSRFSVEEKKLKMIETLQGNKSRFKSGKEVKRKTALWGLRSRIPPPVPVVILPDTVPITDSVMDAIKFSGKRPKSLIKANSTPITLKRNRKPPTHSSDAFDTSSQNSVTKLNSTNEKTEKKKQNNKRFQPRLRTRSARKFFENSPTSLTSDSEDTSSSHGTLNSIIPHPNNFDGPNNPFISCDQSSTSKSSSIKSSASTSSSPINQTPIIKKSTRKFERRRNTKAKNKTNCILSNLIGKAPAVRVTRNSSFLLGRNEEPGTSKSNLKDLDTSMNSYFGAENRIADGEKFTVLGKRVATDGRIQYLIEWEGMSS